MAFVDIDGIRTRYEVSGSGPPLEMRLSAEQVVRELTAGGLVAQVVGETMPRHYVVRGVKPG